MTIIMYLLKIGIFILCIIIKCASFTDPETRVKQGRLRGKYQETVKGRTFISFTGIPYAKPPIGELRFEAPVPADTWEDVFDARNSHPVCPQIPLLLGKENIIGDEDCLYLNVYTPQVTRSSNFPVMIYLHGGAFAFLSARPEDLGADVLLDKDIVLVTLNYRLGALGFLATGDEIVPGNNGLKDQSLAIKWVKKNIINFGGDPNKITLFGQSAGGASAHFHALSPLSKDLIHGVIAQSGTALNVWAIAPGDLGQRNSKKLAEYLLCPVVPSKDMVECLKKVKVQDIIRQYIKYHEWNVDPLSAFIPVIEPNIEGAFLSEHPVEIYKAGRVANIPLMTGLTTEDGSTKVPALFSKPKLLKEFNDDFDRVAPITLRFEESLPNKNVIVKQIRQFYFRNEEINDSSLTQIIKMYTDGIYLLPEDSTVRLHLANVERPVYYYLFGNRAPVSFCDALGDPSYDYGVCHCDDLMYLFSFGVLPKYEFRAADLRVREIILTLWTNFARTGNPTSNIQELNVTTWEPVKTQKLEYYYIKSDMDVHMDENMYEDRLKFWKRLPLNVKYITRDEL